MVKRPMYVDIEFQICQRILQARNNDDLWFKVLFSTSNLPEKISPFFCSSAAGIHAPLGPRTTRTAPHNVVLAPTGSGAWIPGLL